MEQQYLDLLNKCLTTSPRKTRNATTYSVFGERLVHDFKDGFPLLTTKKMFLKGIVEELAWFLRGSTDVNELREKGVHIWDINSADRNYDAGPVYGFQWRHFGAEYVDCKTDYTGKGVDQIASVIDQIKTDPTSRRILLSAWNPMAQKDMCLPPCHVSYQFYVNDGKLSCQMYQRSADIFLGLPFNIASTALLLMLIAHETDLKPDKLIMCLGDVHLYSQHIEAAKSQLSREPHSFPLLSVEREADGLTKVKMKDVCLSNYKYYPRLKAPMMK